MPTRCPSSPPSFAVLTLGLSLGLGCTGDIAAGGAARSPEGAPAPGSEPAPGAPGAPPGPGAPGSGAAAAPGAASPATCEPVAAAPRTHISPGPAPIRRLTRFELNNTLRDLLGYPTKAANLLPSEDLGNGFGNDAETLSVSTLLAESYARVAEIVAASVTASPQELGKLAPCAAAPPPGAEEACARTIISAFVPRAFRRPIEAAEIDELVVLYRATRQAGFATGVASVIEAVVQSPEFLYRVELGVRDPARPDVRRPSGHEMAARLSYLFWGTMPDETLRKAAEAGELAGARGVLAQATRLLDDRRSRDVMRFFFDDYLPIGGLAQLERDARRFPAFTPAVGGFMREETQRLLDSVIFEAPGDWPSAFTAGFTFVNEPLAKLYGLAGVTGTTFRKVMTDGSKRLGFLTHAGVMAGTTHSSVTSPVIRGAFVAHNLLCRHIPSPTGDIAAAAVPPAPDRAPTARQRYTEHGANPTCAGCHSLIDPIGLALENYDAIGVWRDRENGVAIDASGAVPGLPEGAVNGPIELARKLGAADEVRTCFARSWMTFAYGRALKPQDACSQAAVEGAFKTSGYNVRQLLLALTQTDAFLYLPAAL